MPLVSLTESIQGKRVPSPYASWHTLPHKPKLLSADNTVTTARPLRVMKEKYVKNSVQLKQHVEYYQQDMSLGQPEKLKLWGYLLFRYMAR